MKCHLCNSEAVSEYVATCQSCMDDAPYTRICKDFRAATTIDELRESWIKHNQEIAYIKNNPGKYQDGLFIHIENCKDYYRKLLDK